HYLTAGGILALGIIASGVPSLRGPDIFVPWELFFLAPLILAWMNVRSFASAAQFHSFQLLGETHRWSRLGTGRMKFTKINGVDYVGVPIGGWRYLAVRLSSLRNKMYAVFPAELLEKIGNSDVFLIARATFYRVSPQMLGILAKDRTFRRFLGDL